MLATRPTTTEDIARADMERAAQASWLALCELQPTPRDVATPAGLHRWSRAVNERAKEIFSRLQ